MSMEYLKLQRLISALVGLLGELCELGNFSFELLITQKGTELYRAVKVEEEDK